MKTPPLYSRDPVWLIARTSALALALLAAPNLHAQEYWWDNNGTTTGFGTAGGTWSSGGSTLWSTNSTGGADATLGTSVTTGGNTLNFGTHTSSLATGTITVSGNVSSGWIRFGASSGNITLSGGNITLGGNIITSGSTSATHTITSNITLSNARTIGTNTTNRFIVTGVISGGYDLITLGAAGFVALNGTNTFTGNIWEQRGQINFSSIANAGQSSALGAGSQITLGLNGPQSLRAWYTGADSASSNRTWNIQGSSTLIAQNGSLHLTGNLVSNQAWNMTVALTGTADTGINEISGIINDAVGGNVTSVTLNNAAPTGGANEAGFWILSGNNSYEGATTVANSSRLRIAHANALGTTAAGTTVQNGSVLELAGGISVGAEALSIQGTGISLGGALRNISGNNSYAGAITLAAASRINSDADLLTLSGAISGAQNLTFGGAGNTTVSGNITTSTGTLTKIDAGTLTISGTGNTYSGATTISAGTLAVSGNLSNSAITLASGATLNGAGTVGTVAVNGTMAGSLSAGAITLNSGGIITPNTNGSVGTIGSSSITINGGGYNWTLSGANGSAGTGYDQITSTGALTSSSLLTVYAYGTPGDWDGSANYSWDIFSAASLSSAFDSTKFTLDLSNFGIAAGNRTGSWSFSNPSGGTITLTYTAPSASDPVWEGGTGNFSTGFTPAASNGDTIAFTGAGGTATNDSLTSVNDLVFRAGSGSYTIAGTALTVNGSIINSSTATQTFSTAPTGDATFDANAGDITISGIYSGSGNLTKAGVNTLTLSNDNTYSGATNINAGILRAAHSNALGSTVGGTTVGSVGALELSGGISIGAEALSLSGAGISSGGALRNISGDNSYGGDITLAAASRINSDAGSLTLSGAISGTQNLTFGGAGNTTVTGNITTSAGTLSKDGAGTLTLSGTNTYSGATTISAGTLVIGGTGRLGGGTYSGNIAINGAASEFIFAGTNSQTLSGTISGNGALTMNGSGTLTLSGASKTNTGGVTINAGTVLVSGGAFSTNITVNSGAALTASGQYLIANGATLTLNGGTLNTGTFYTEPGAIVMDNGTINGNAIGHILSNNGWTGNGNNTINHQVSLENTKAGSGLFDIQSGTTTIHSIVYNYLNRSFGITKNGTGALVLNGANTFAGTTTLNAGTLVLNNNTALGTSSLTIVSGTLDNTSGSAKTLTNNNAQNWNGNFAFTGTNDLNLGTGAVTMNASRTVTVNGGNLTVGGAIGGAGFGLTKNGTGTLILSGASTYNGTTTVNDGTLTLSGGSAIADTGAVSVSSGAVLNLISSETVGSIAGAGNITLGSNTLTTGGDNSSTTFTGLISGIGGGLTKNGTGTLALTNASNDYSGATTINAGTISISAVGALGSTSGVNLGNATELLYTGSAATLSRNITVTSGTATVANSGSGELTLSGGLSNNGTTLALDGGAQGIDVTGAITGSLANSDLVVDGNVTLSTANSYNGQTTIHGNLTAAVADALGSTSSVVINTGGSLLVGANETINDSADMTLAGGTLKFSGNFTETLGSLTLSANSVIDMGGGNIALEFADMVAGLTDTTRLNIYNYQMDSDHIYFGSNANLSSSLQFISFYSDFGSSFIGNGFIEGFSPPYELQAQAVQVVPEPETWATGLLLLLGGGAWMWRKRRNLPTTGKAGALEEDLPKVGR